MQARFGGVVSKGIDSERYGNAAVLYGAATVPAIYVARGGMRRERAANRAKTAANRSYNRNNAAMGRMELQADGKNRFKGRNNKFDGGRELRRVADARDRAALRMTEYERLARTGRKMKIGGSIGAALTGALAVGSAVAAERSRKNSTRVDPRIVARRRAEARRNGLL